MITLQNDKIRVDFADGGADIRISDIARGQAWALDPQSLLCEADDNTAGLLTPVSISQEGAGVVIVYEAFGRRITIRYALLPDGVETTLLAGQSDTALSAALPGSFRPDGAMKYLLPIKQGMLWDLRGAPFSNRHRYGAHSGVSMAMVGCLGAAGGLLTAAETADDCTWHVGKDESGRCWAYCVQEASLGAWGYDRAVRLYVTDAAITAVAKRYRARVMERGRFKSWAEKIAERPSVRKLFGTTLCFIGYMQDDIDYAAECAKLKAQGVDKAMIYPVRFNTCSRTTVLHGVPTVEISHADTAKIKALGYEVAPWSWITELMKDGDESQIQYRVNAEGKHSLFWQMDGQQYFKTCSGGFADFQRAANAGPCADTTWDHFDVMATSHNGECHALDHPSHPGRPLSRAEDREHIRALFRAAQEGDRVISSEGFIDAYSMEYDLGATKAWPRFGPWQYWPIPLTMLVYHDSMAHTWWEMHNYNGSHFGDECGTHQYGSGQPRIMAAMDALYGCPPQVFPFGSQYAWKTAFKETYIYKMRLDDPETQYALSLAKPVAALHGEIGMLEMTDFEILSGDGNLQKTTFADGTVVYANFAVGNSRAVDGIGELQGESWRVVRPAKPEQEGCAR